MIMLHSSWRGRLSSIARRGAAGWAKVSTPSLGVLAVAVVALVAAAGCQPSTPPPAPPAVTQAVPQRVPTLAAGAPAAPQAGRAAQDAAPGIPPVGAAGAAAPTLPVMPAADPPAGALYFCEVDGARTPIEYETRVDRLCRRHPEMGPCQYEREACRARGGRVYTARDEEVTPAVELEYDRVVRRVRLQAEGGVSQR